MEKIIIDVGNLTYQSLVEIGCGDGKIITEVARAYPDRKYVGTDYSEKSLRLAQSFSPALTFVTKTIEKFDGFLLIEVIEHIPPEEMLEFIGSLADTLLPGGFGIISTPCDNVPLIHKHYQHFNKDSLCSILESHFEIVSFEYTNADTLLSKIIKRLLANRFFILNHSKLVNSLYELYKRNCLIASPKNATQVYAIVRKK